MAIYNVIFATRYSFIPEGKTETLSGGRLTVLVPVEPGKPDQKGQIPVDFKTSAGVFEKMPNIPGKYDLTEAPVMVKDAQDKPIVTIRITDAKPV